MTDLTIVNERLAEIEGEIKSRLKRQWEDVLEIGKLAIEAQGLVQYGQFQKWIRDQLHLSLSLIYGYMRCAQRLSSCANFARLPITAGLLLASPSVPDGALAEIERRLADGETFTIAGVESIIDKYKVFQSVNVGGQAILQEYGMKNGQPAKQINRPDITSLVTVTGEALERGVVNIEGDDHALPDAHPKVMLKPIADLPNVPIFTIPNTVKAAAKSESARRQESHIQNHAAALVISNSETIVTRIDGDQITLKNPGFQDELHEGDVVIVTIRRKTEE